MKRERARLVLADVAEGRVSVADALKLFDEEPIQTLEFANIDHHRALRQGFPEVVYGAGKSEAQVVAICKEIAAHGDGFLVTRTNESQRAAIAARFPTAIASEMARTVRLTGDERSASSARAGTVLVVTAGTSDLPVAEEAMETLRALGIPAERVADVGVAGIHRVLAHHSALSAAAVVIVVAGMDGALPSVVGGLVRAPVIAVPTSVGYGSSFEGLAALLTMLNSCAAGVVVCNIDNGFGAAMAAARAIDSATMVAWP